ncbi:hypothetical protein Ddye_018220 [Dipteronia dyeriana]|uniref:Uncharacterized protein n=1 Tax=Dipteronia dyeriana TaxID=168575 RepID=A0AAD9X191_9ROSI|nr:hypothetical protein Ddye_018220 [Dipteronia dyeriana]
MEENEHQYREWQGNNVEEVLEPTPDCCIYRVPRYLRKINKGAYTPWLISIGPLHYGRKELMGMQNQKRRYWTKFGERVNNEEKLEELKTYIKNQEQRIRDHYSVTSKIQSSKYVAMILYDAVFIIELFLRKYHRTNDFLLKVPLAASVLKDILLLENQVPYFVLNDLYAKAFPSNERNNPSFFSLSHNFFRDLLISNNVLILAEHLPQVKHLTDFLRRALVMKVQTIEKRDRGYIYDLPSVTKLKESGLNFRCIDECFLDVSLAKRRHGKWLPWFKVNELQIPRTQICDETECLFRNLMALEVFHYPIQSQVCDYAFLMDYLIDTIKDVDLLVEKGIIANYMGNNEAIAKMFNRLCSNIPITESCYYDVAEKLRAHYKYPWNHVKATLKSVYFGNLWTGTATVAAIFLLILTAIQTACSIMQL